MTKQRAAILETVESTDEHLSAQEIFDTVKKVLPNIVLATVYNNLGALEKAGRIRRVSLGGTTDRFERYVKPHAHIMCDTCGEVQNAEIVGLAGFLKEHVNVPVKSYDLIIHTVCKKCALKSKKKGY